MEDVEAVEDDTGFVVEGLEEELLEDDVVVVELCDGAVVVVGVEENENENE